MPPIRVLIPRAITDMDEDLRLDIMHLLNYAKTLPKTLEGIVSDSESNIWARNSDELLADAEDSFFYMLAIQQVQNIADLMIALGLEAHIEKGIDDRFFPTLNSLMARSKQARDTFISKVKKAGKATKAQLAIIDEVLRRDLPNYAQLAEQFMLRACFLGKLRATIPQKTVEDLMTLGAYIDRMPTSIINARHEGMVLTKKQKAMAETRGELVEVLPLSDYEARKVAMASKRCADKVQEVSLRVQARIKDTVKTALEERWSAKQLEMAFFDEFGDLNRDWRRVAITELAMASNDAFLAGCPEGSEVWVPPITKSCKYCKALLEGKVFKVFHSEPTNITYDIEMKTLWPGKTNYGRKVATWVPCLPLHPNCRHRATPMSRFYSMQEGKPRMKTSIELIQEERARRGLAPDPNIEQTLKKLRQEWSDK